MTYVPQCCSFDVDGNPEVCRCMGPAPIEPDGEHAAYLAQVAREREDFARRVAAGEATYDAEGPF
jgi:hypothetical protein